MPTPNNAAPNRLPTAGLLRRITSMAYDTLLLAGVLVVFFLLPQTLLGVFTGIAASRWVVWLHLIVLLMVYFGWFWLHGGQTLAMRTWKIQVVDINGGPLRPLQAVFRYLVAWFSISCAGIGILWSLFDRDKQFLHDRLADTRLVSIAPDKPKNTVPTTF